MKDWRDILPTRGSTKAPRWTDEGDGRLRLMWAEGVQIKCIAKELRRSVSGIYGRVKILNLPWRPRANAAKPKPPPVVVAAPAPVPTQVIAPPSGLPPSLRYEDDPRASSEFDPLPAPTPGDVTAAMMGDPAPGRSAA